MTGSAEGTLAIKPLELFLRRPLGRLGPDAGAAGPALVEAIRTDGNAGVRQAAIKALPDIGADAELVLPTLIEALLDDPDFGVRWLAAQALGDLDREAYPAVPALKEALEDEHPRVRQFAKDSLQRITKVERVQASLVELGYDAGSADGLIGTRAAIRAFQKARGLSVTGEVSDELFYQLTDAVESLHDAALHAARTIEYSHYLRCVQKLRDLIRVSHVGTQNVDVNAKNEIGYTALHMAVIMGRRAQAEELLTQGADIHSKDRFGATPLHWAARRGRPNIAELLLKKGANIKAKDQFSDTPLHYAAGNGRAAMLALALTQNTKGESEEHFKVMTQTWWSHDNLRWSHDNRHIAVGKLLIERGSYVEGKNLTDQTPLHLAGIMGYSAVAELLIAYGGANVNSRDSLGLTPLHGAARFGHVAMVQMLISRGARINAKAESGKTPLHEAVQNGQTTVAELLIAKGADVYSKDNRGRTPLNS